MRLLRRAIMHLLYRFKLCSQQITVVGAIRESPLRNQLLDSYFKLVLEDVLAEEILSGRLGEGDTEVVDVNEEGKVKISPQLKKKELLPSS